MKRQRAYISFIIFLFSILSFYETPSHAKENPKIKQEIIKKGKRLEHVERKLKTEKQKLDIISKKEGSTLTELDRIEKELAKKEDELLRLEKNIKGLKSKIDAANQDIRELVKEKERLHLLLQKRVAAMYKMREGGAVKLLFSSESPNDFSRRYKYINEVIDSDLELLDRYDKNKQTLEDEKEKLDAIKSQVQSLKDRALIRKQDIAAEKKKRYAVLASIRKEKELHLSALEELEKTAKDLQSVIDELKKQQEREQERRLSKGKDNTPRDLEPMPSTGFGAMRGKLSMPVAGSVVSLFGRVENPKFHTITFNNGIEIEAPIGTAVRAVYKGKVIYSDWLKGYGRIIILDHGDSFYTLYAHLSKALKEVNDIIEKGDVIAEVGDSGSLDGPGLYFEVRYKGVPKDPMAWLAK